MNIIAIDPGNTESAYCIIEKETLKPIKFDIISNFDLIEKIKELYIEYRIEKFAIEMIESYGMAVGKDVFETCVWIGKFMREIEKLYQRSGAYLIYRKDEKMHICNSTKAKDSNIRQALIDRFGEVGTKKNQGWFYGFKADIWAAYAVGITLIETKLNA